MEINEYKKNQAEKYLSNDYIASFIRENGLSVQDILDNFTAFDSFIALETPFTNKFGITFVYKLPRSNNYSISLSYCF